MISIKKISSSKSAADYFKDADYYAKGDDNGSEIISEWKGSGAKELGLEGSVNIKTFKDALDGKIGGEELGRSLGNGEKEHTKGWDLTLSAPKSISILALAGGDKRLLEAHKQAVDKTLAYVEKNHITTRVTKGDSTINLKTGNLTAASFTHTTSRDLDPQLHTHNVVLNVTKRQDGMLRSLDSRTIYDDSMTAGLVYRSELAKSVKSLGYDINITDTRKGLFEIKDVPKGVLEAFSKRRAAIEKAANERDIKTTKGMQAAALATRKSKQKANGKELLSQWDKELEGLNFDPQKAIDNSLSVSKDEPSLQGGEQNNLNAEPSQASTGSALDDVRFAYKHLAEKEAVFEHRQVFKLALKVSLGRHSAGDIGQAIARLLKEKEIVKSQLKGVNAFTTPAALKTEKYTLDLMKRGKGEVSAVASKGVINTHLEGKGLNTGQAEAARMVLSSRDRVVGIQGYAGTGKTFMLAQVKDIAEAKGYKLSGAAFSSTAADELESGSGIKSQTLASFLNDKKGLLAKGKLRGNKEIWVVDEASLVNSKDMASLLTLSRKANSRVLLVGDKAQIGAIEWGKPFHQMMDNGMRHGVMSNIRRQRDPELLKAVKSIINKSPFEAFSAIKNDIKEIADKDERIEAIANDYLKLSPDDRKKMLIVIPDNETRQAVMNLIREGLQKEGTISVNKVESSVLINKGLSDIEKGRAQFYNKGDVVEFGKDQKRLGVKKSERFVVDKVAGDTLTLKSDKRVLKWNPSKVAGSAKNGVEVYKQEERSWSVGDVVRWKKNLPDRDLKNGDTGKILSIDKGKMRIAFGRGAKTIDINQDKHIDHNYAVTAFASQGMTFNQVAVMAESWRKNLVNQKSFYVGISRAKDKAFIYTEDKKGLAKAISDRSGEKTSALNNRISSKGLDNDGLIDIFKEKVSKLGKALTGKSREVGIDIDL